MSADLPRPWRVPLLILGMLSLFGGTAAGLLRLGWNAPLPGTASVLDHGPLMIGAFLGTVISLERAVALGARWAYSAPLCAGLGGLALLLTGTLAAFSNLPGAGRVFPATLLALAVWLLNQDGARYFSRD